MPGLRAVPYCEDCKSAEVVQAVPALNLGCLTRVAAWVLGIVLLKFVFTHLADIARFLMLALSWLFDAPLFREIGGLLSLFFALWVFLWLTALFTPGRTRDVNVFPRFIPWLLRATWAATVFTGRLLYRAVEGVPDKSRKSVKKGKPEEGSS